jgi:PAT family beta-lactamase induction signal transducer AmpG
MTDNKFDWSLVFSQRMLVCIFTGIASGLPFYILLQLVPAWLRVEGIGLKEIGLISLVLMPYTWKLLWAPFLDRYAFPLYGSNAHRRGWMLCFQLIMLGVIAVLGYARPKEDLQLIVILTLILAFFSASLDIVIDAYRRELLPDIELGLGNTIHVQAYRVASLVPGSLALILADSMEWSQVFQIVAVFMLFGIGLAIFAPEPQRDIQRPHTLREATVEPFKEFLQRGGYKHALLVISFMFLYKLGDNMAVALATPFYIDLGFSLTEIGLVAKHAALWPAVIGGIFGGLLMLKWGINKSLWIFGVVQLLTILGFAILAEAGDNIWVLAGVISAEYLGVGLGTAAFTAFMARETTPAYAGFQLATFTALASVPRAFANATTGFVVESIGWTSFFLFCAVCAIPGLLLLFKVAPLGRDKADNP